MAQSAVFTLQKARVLMCGFSICLPAVSKDGHRASKDDPTGLCVGDAHNW